MIFTRLCGRFEFEAEVEFDSIGGSKWIFDLLDFERATKAWDLLVNLIVSVFDIIAVLVMHVSRKYMIRTIDGRDGIVVLRVVAH